MEFDNVLSVSQESPQNLPVRGLSRGFSTPHSISKKRNREAEDPQSLSLALMCMRAAMLIM